jgi:adenylate kinase family enzyme
LSDPLARIHVVGTSGSGKSELARRLSLLLGSPHVEIDDLHWLPGWQERPREELRASVSRIVATDRWILCGNYARHCQDLTFPRATAIVWLDYSFPLTFWRALKRTVRRVVTGEACCNGNRETLRKALLSRESILVWVIQTHGSNRRAYPLRFARPENAHLRVLRFRSPRETEAWTKTLSEARPVPCDR